MKSAPPFNDNSSGLGSGSLCPGADTVSIGSSTDEEKDGGGDDVFSRLRAERLREQQRVLLARSISAVAEARISPTEELSLMDMTTDSQTQLIRPMSASSQNRP